MSQIAAYGNSVTQAGESAACPITQSCSSENVGSNERLASVFVGGWLTVSGLLKGSLSGLCRAAMGGSLLYRGVKGHCSLYQVLGVSTAEPASQASLTSGEGFRIEKQVRVNTSPEELYRFWRRLENLPRVLGHIKSVVQTDALRSTWVARGPFNSDFTWEAEIVEEKPGELIAWRSLPGSTVATAGSVHFQRTPNTGATDVTVVLRYSPPGGVVGKAIASLFDESPENQVERELDFFRQFIEAAPRQHGVESEVMAGVGGSRMQ